MSETRVSQYILPDSTRTRTGNSLMIEFLEEDQFDDRFDDDVR